MKLANIMQFEIKDNSKKNKYNYYFNISAIGEFKTGKTTILRQFLGNNNWPIPIHLEKIETTSDKIIKVNKNNIAIKCHDTHGLEQKCLPYNILRISDGILLVYDITSRESFNKLSMWIEAISLHSYRNVKVILIGNKLDLENNREVLYDEGLHLSNMYNFQFIEVSGITNVNVDESFLQLIDSLIKIYEPLCNSLKDSINPISKCYY